MNSTNSINIEDCWTILDNYFYNKGLVKHQIDSYDEFICENINKIIESSPPIIIDIPISGTLKNKSSLELNSRSSRFALQNSLGENEQLSGTGSRDASLRATPSRQHNQRRDLYMKDCGIYV